MLTVKIVPSTDKAMPAKLADVELHFTEGPLAGMKLIGFAIWERRTGAGRNVTYPSRTYRVNGEQRSFALLRPVGEVGVENNLRAVILDAFATYEEQQEAQKSAEADGSPLGTRYTLPPDKQGA